jgi:nitrate reductase gamma subunit
MYNSNNTNEILEVIGQVLIRCFVMGVLVLLFWFGALTLAGDLAYSVHANFVPITQQQFYVIHYVGGLMTKAAVFFLFLFPYIAIRLVIRKR